jgi:hypothetical protein
LSHRARSSRSLGSGAARTDGPGTPQLGMQGSSRALPRRAGGCADGSRPSLSYRNASLGCGEQNLRRWPSEGVRPLWQEAAARDLPSGHGTRRTRREAGPVGSARTQRSRAPASLWPRFVGWRLVAGSPSSAARWPLVLWAGERGERPAAVDCAREAVAEVPSSDPAEATVAEPIRKVGLQPEGAEPWQEVKG